MLNVFHVNVMERDTGKGGGEEVDAELRIVDVKCKIRVSVACMSLNSWELTFSNS